LTLLAMIVVLFAGLLLHFYWLFILLGWWRLPCCLTCMC